MGGAGAVVIFPSVCECVCATWQAININSQALYEPAAKRRKKDYMPQDGAGTGTGAEAGASIKQSL